jgi:molybdopterin converting factor small subunit
MPAVSLKLPSWIAAKLGENASGWFSLDREITESTTIEGLLKEMVAAYPGFREVVYNPDTGLPTEQVNFVLNDRLLTYREVSQIKLAEGDVIMLIPLYTGG